MAALPDTAALRRGAWLLIVLGAVGSLSALAMPIFSMQVFNRVLPTGSLETLFWLAVALIVVVPVQGVLDHLRGTAMVSVGNRWLDRLVEPLLRAGTGPRGAQELMRDLDTLRSTCSAPAAAAPLDFIWTPLFLAAAFLLHPLFGLLLVAGAAALAGLNVAATFLVRPALMSANDLAASSFAEAAGTIRAAEVVRAMGMLPALQRRWRVGRGGMLLLAHRAQRLAKGLATTARVLRMLLAAATMALGAVLCLRGVADAGTMLAANLIVARALQPFEQAGAAWRLWSEALAAHRRIAAALGAAPAEGGAVALPRPVGRIVSERLVFLPPGAERPVLRGASFTIEPGEMLALTGASGSGKSTLVRLLLGAERPSAGTIHLDGYPTHLWERAELARHLGYLPQHLGLVDGTVTQNVSRFAAPPDMAAVIAATRLAGAQDAVARLPAGYGTRIGPNGFALSAGQRQCLALARALHGDPRLLVLDEPDAHLDAEGEARLLRTLARVRARGIGVLVITHRPALLAAADRRLLLRDGMLLPEAAGTVPPTSAKPEIASQGTAPPARIGAVA